MYVGSLWMGRSFTAVLLFGVFSHSKDCIVAQFVKFLYEMFGFCKYSSDKFKIVIQRASPCIVQGSIIQRCYLKRNTFGKTSQKVTSLDSLFFQIHVHVHADALKRAADIAENENTRIAIHRPIDLRVLPERLFGEQRFELVNILFLKL